jgi:glycosyltransferase involved in cell wall biosynthesis
MIAIFTSNSSGGVIQFVMQLVYSCSNINMEVIAFVPSGSQYSLERSLESKVKFYEKKKSIKSLSSDAIVISNQIAEENPDLVWFIDDAILSMKVLVALFNRVQTFLTIHDVNPHLYQFNIRRSIVSNIKKFIRPKAFRNATKIVLLSENSHSHFIRKFPKNKMKTEVFKLGAHIPVAAPQNISLNPEFESGYYLFFGRIDKYKGISNLLNAYLAISKEVDIPLVIAGQGKLSDRESLLVQKDSKIVLLNRFIEDGEMIWLFQNARALILPYLEASQSGIIPIAYHYGKPVLVMDLPGLTEFVVEGKTGLVARNAVELVKSMQKLSDDSLIKAMGIEAVKYEDENLLWEKNIEKLLES